MRRQRVGSSVRLDENGLEIETGSYETQGREQHLRNARNTVNDR